MTIRFGGGWARRLGIVLSVAWSIAAALLFGTEALAIAAPADDLIIAATNGDLGAVQRLLDGGVEADSRGNNGVTALFMASQKGHLDVVEALLDNGADVNANVGRGATALEEASVDGHVDVVRTLIAKGADVNARLSSGYTALILVSGLPSDRIDIVQALLGAGADVNARAENGATALFETSRPGHKDIVQALLDNKADVDAKITATGFTALIRAAEYGHVDIVQALLDKGANVNTKAMHDWTALFLASSTGHRDAAKVLLDNGADINAKATDGMTALIIASRNGHSDVVQVLLDKGADINARNTSGVTALTLAGDDQTRTLLVKAGATDEQYNVAAASLANQSVTVPLPGSPFGVVTSPDGKWVFVSVTDPRPRQEIKAADGTNLRHLGNLVVLENTSGQIKIHRILPMANMPFGMALTHDGKLLMVAAQGAGGAGSVIFFDLDRLVVGDKDPRHYIAPNAAFISEGPRAASISVNVTADDKTLFVSNEFSSTIGVINLENLRAYGLTPAAELGRIPVGISPTALTFSPDGRWLYTTSEGAPPSLGWPKTLKQEDGGPGMVSEGAVIVIDVAKARIDPEHSVVAQVPAGGSPVRLALSPDGARLYVTARASDAVLTFDTARLISDPLNARLSTTPVGKSPVPIALVKNGGLAVIGLSNRYGAGEARPSTLSVLDTARIGKSNPVVGSFPAGAFPRELDLSPDGETLYWTNYGSRSLQAINIDQLPH